MSARSSRLTNSQRYSAAHVAKVLQLIRAKKVRLLLQDRTLCLGVFEDEMQALKLADQQRRPVRARLDTDGQLARCAQELGDLVGGAGCEGGAVLATASTQSVTS